MSLINNAKHMVVLFVLFFVSVSVHSATISLEGTIRDFSFSHPDFENQRINGAGLTTGLVELFLGPDGKPVYIGGNTLSTQSNFDEWFRDVPSINQSFLYDFVLRENANGFFSYSNQAYFPINGLGFGNEGGHTRNYSFTTEINAEFTYTGFTAQVDDFIFTGDDDVWAFINGQLVVDLGGTHSPKTGGVDIDSLGLTLGETYSLKIFQAERQTSGSTFSFSTAASLRPASIPEPASILLLSLALVLLRAKRKF